MPWHNKIHKLLYEYMILMLIAIKWCASYNTYTSRTIQNPGQKLKDLLAKEGGDFQRVEVKLKRWRQEEIEHNKAGAWVTKIYLADTKKWTKILGLV